MSAISAPTAVIAAGATGSAYFNGDPNATGNLTPWQYADDGGDSSVATHPAGVTSPGVVGVAQDPLGQQGKVYQETVTPTSSYVGGTSNADWTSVYNGPTSYYGSNGQEDWVHFRVMFPAGAYRPTHTEWNWLHESHDDSGFLPWYNAGQISREIPELAIGVANNPGSTAQLFMQVRGGQDTNMGAATAIYSNSALRYNHWYDIVLHEIWSPDPTTGLVQWWMDGKRLYSNHLADLWQRPDGSYDHVQFELNNYRQHSSSNSTVYYSQTKIGPTPASVAF